MGITLRLAAASLLVSACGASTRWADAREVEASVGRRIDIEAGSHGFAPAELRARAGETVALVFTRTDASRCVERVFVQLDEHRRVERALPLRQPVRLTLRLPHAGEVGISCGMQMFGATLIVEP